MALFSDGNITSLAELREIESGILDVAKVEDIDLTAKLRMSWEEVCTDIETFLRRNPEAAGGAGIQHVAVTEPLKRCHRLRALALTYQDAVCGQSSERYERQYRMYETLYAQSLAKVFEGGIGLVALPLPAAPLPLVTYLPGAEAPLYVQMSWTNERNQEGVAGEPVEVNGTAGHGFLVQAPSAPMYATGWNVYIGTDPAALQRQNDRPLRFFENWEYMDGPLKPGPLAGSGQSAERWMRRERRLRRG